MTAARRLTLEILGWVLVVAGVAALVLPGPGLLMLFAGVAILSQQYDWAERRLAPLKFRALKGAAESVEAWWRIVVTLAGISVLGACGVLWILSPPVPGWWPVPDSWWLPGGVVTGITQVVSAIVAVALLIYSYRRFHDNPAAVAALEHELEEATRAREERDAAR